MWWENKIHFDCLLSLQHLCQKLSQSNCAFKNYTSCEGGTFFGTQCSSSSSSSSSIIKAQNFRLLTTGRWRRGDCLALRYIASEFNIFTK